MPNTDNTYGTFNKQTKTYKQLRDPSSQVHTVFADLDQAKSYFFTDDALTIFDECCTQISWALIADEYGDNTGLKVTYAFGTKGSPTQSAADDWAEQFKTRQQALIDSNTFFRATTSNNLEYNDSTDHLF